MYKRKIYQIAESNQIESKLFLPELECSNDHESFILLTVLFKGTDMTEDVYDKITNYNYKLHPQL